MSGIDQYRSGELDTANIGPATNEVAPGGRPANTQDSVLWVGPWFRIADGFNEHVRRAALALSRAGASVHLRATNITALGEPPDEGVSEEVCKLAEQDTGSYRYAVHQMVFNREGIRVALNVPENIGLPQVAIEHLRKQRIVYTVFERDDIPAEDGIVLAQAGQVWVACQDNADAVLRAGVPRERVHVVPCPFMPDDPLLALQGRTRKPGVPRFYHVGKWEPRKEQRNILKAFLLAFRPGEAQLYLRSSPMRVQLADYPSSPTEALAQLLEEPAVQAMGWTTRDPVALAQAIKIIEVPLALPKLIELHGACDVYVSLSRAEGFDMPAFDAKLAGNRLIYTQTAARDFAGEADIMVPRTGTLDAHPVYNWIGATYGDYDIADAVAAMRASAEAVRAGAPSPRDLSAWSLEQVGKKMHVLLTEPAPAQSTP
jgi:glycosyltransferase involved in cell wall biosynthesis